MTIRNRVPVGVFKVTADQFVYRAALAAASDPRIAASITDPYDYGPADLSKATCFLAFQDSVCVGGFMVLEDELCCLWSTVRGVGSFLVRHAITEGATVLNCFDGGLVDYYRKHGFEEYCRTPNWTEGEPDVVFMELLA